MTRVLHVSMKCLIQQNLLGTILIQFQHTSKNDNYNDFLKIQIYCISFYYNYRNKEQILLNQS